MILLTSRLANASPFRKNSVMARGLLLSSCLFVLSACSPGQSNTNAPQAKSSNTQNAPLIVPPGSGNLPLQPGQSGAQYTPNGLPALQPPKGINYETLFNTRLKDEEQRFQRLENAVTDLRREFESVKPSVVRLVAVEGDIQNLIQELETLLQNEPPSSAAPSATPYVAPVSQSGGAGSAPVLAVPTSQPPKVVAPKAVVKTPPVPLSNSGDAQRLRFGEHSDKTRIVIDAARAIQYSVDLDNAEKLLVIDLPDAYWGGQTSWSSPKSPLVTSYTVQKTDSGSRIVMLLKRTSSVLKKSLLKPNKDSGSYRLVIDLKK